MTKKKKKKITEAQRKREEQKEKKRLKELKAKREAQRGIVAILLFLLGVLFLLGFMEKAGVIGNFLNKLGGKLFGWGKWFFPLVLFLSAGVLIFRRKLRFYITKIAGSILVFLSLLGLFHFFYNPNNFLKIAQTGKGGGYLGYILAIVLFKLTGKIAGIAILVALLLIGNIIAFNFSFVKWINKIVNFWKTILSHKKIKEEQEDVDIEKKEEQEKEEIEKSLVNNDRDKMQPGIPLQAQEKLEKKADLLEGSNKKDNKKEKKEKSEVNNNIKNIEFLDEDSFSKKELLQEKENYNLELDYKTTENLSKASKGPSDNYKTFQWKLPPFNLISATPKKQRIAKNNQRDLKEKQQKIVETLGHFGIKVDPVGIQEGPTVIQYTFSPAVGVKLSKITSLGDDLALALAAHSIRIEAPIPGKSLIGIEMPNPNREILMPREILKSEAFQKFNGHLPIALGKDINGKDVISSLTQMPHLLIAGTTGSGKSVTMGAVLLSLLYKNSPEDLKLILIDPKRVEFSHYEGVPHLISNVIKDHKKIINALKWTIHEMKKRYKLIERSGSRDIESYNQKAFLGLTLPAQDDETEEVVIKKMPYLVVVIDELAEIIINQKREVENLIVQIAQLGRAAGVHLVISTQKPKADIVTSLIKSNIPSRIALSVRSQIDSRTILDQSGAEKLLGKGELLFLGPNTDQVIRLQGIFVSENDIRSVVKFWKRQADKLKKIKKSINDINSDQKMFASETDNSNIKSENKEINEIDKKIESNQNLFNNNSLNNLNFEELTPEEEGDELYLQAKSIVVQAGKASTSLLQRRLSIGYPKAARLIDMLEEKGIIGPAQGAKPREVLIDKTENASVNENKKSTHKSFQNSKQEINYEDHLADQNKRDRWQI